MNNFTSFNYYVYFNVCNTELYIVILCNTCSFCVKQNNLSILVMKILRKAIYSTSILVI